MQIYFVTIDISDRPEEERIGCYWVKTQPFQSMSKRDTGAC